MNANNYPKLLERRFLNATLIYFKISIANVAIALCHGGVPTRMTRSIIVGPLFVQTVELKVKGLLDDFSVLVRIDELKVYYDPRCHLLYI